MVVILESVFKVRFIFTVSRKAGTLIDYCRYNQHRRVLHIPLVKIRKALCPPPRNSAKLESFSTKEPKSPPESFLVSARAAPAYWYIYAHSGVVPYGFVNP